jgi:gamma-glutamyltranspeptidase/glutathione hydrolase
MTWPNRGTAYRPVAMGRRGMVSSAHPLASGAGVRILQQGGNAIDAAVATAATLNVVEPYMSGMAGCGYMLFYSAKERKLRVLDYLGTSVAAANPTEFADHVELSSSPKSPMIPGACGGWLTALERFGTLDRTTVFTPAIEHAEAGAPISIKNAAFYRAGYDTGLLSGETQAVFMPGGTPPKPGAVIRQPLLAETYREVAAGGQEVFYRGELGKRIAAAMQAQGGNLSEEDLADFQPEWQEPISTMYRDYQIACPALPCSGIQYLETFNLLAGYDLAATGQNSAETIHLFAEAMKLAIADRIAYTTHPGISSEKLLSPEYAAERRDMIDVASAARSEGERFTSPRPAGSIAPGEAERLLKECTTHFDVVDAEGNAVSVTQSLGNVFGSGWMAGDTGLMLNNLSYWFDLNPASPNVLAPRKKIEMCMAPAAIFQGDDLFTVIGTPGSFGILQTTPQMISNVLDHGFSIQAAIEAPRFRTYEGTTLEVEARIPKSVRDELAERGHQIRLIDDWSPLVGGGQGIMIDPETGVYMGGADPRRDGYAIGW